MSEFDKFNEGLRSTVLLSPEEVKEIKRNERKAWREYGRAECREERRRARANRKRPSSVTPPDQFERE